MRAPPRPAVLIVGPTGSGKTPLGRELEAAGLKGRPCRHFDFGAELRAVSSEPALVPGLDRAELRLIRRSLATGALLEDSEFPAALKTLAAFCGRQPARPGEILVLNGLPRHVGQARGMRRLVRVEAVVLLEATPRVVRLRLMSDAGGDRGGRTDDNESLVSRKLTDYRERTLPLLGYYERRGARILRVRVTPGLSAKAVRRRLLGQWGP